MQQHKDQPASPVSLSFPSNNHPARSNPHHAPGRMAMSTMLYEEKFPDPSKSKKGKPEVNAFGEVVSLFLRRPSRLSLAAATSGTNPDIARHPRCRLAAFPARSSSRVPWQQRSSCWPGVSVFSRAQPLPTIHTTSLHPSPITTTDPLTTLLSPSRSLRPPNSSRSTPTRVGPIA